MTERDTFDSLLDPSSCGDCKGCYGGAAGVYRPSLWRVSMSLAKLLDHAMIPGDSDAVNRTELVICSIVSDKGDDQWNRKDGEECCCILLDVSRKVSKVIIDIGIRAEGFAQSF
eukprot:8190025-Ditylum_brightwellii.AAC.1